MVKILDILSEVSRHDINSAELFNLVSSLEFRSSLHNIKPFSICICMSWWINHCNLLQLDLFVHPFLCNCSASILSVVLSECRDISWKILAGSTNGSSTARTAVHSGGFPTVSPSWTRYAFFTCWDASCPKSAPAISATNPAVTTMNKSAWPWGTFSTGFINASCSTEQASDFIPDPANCPSIKLSYARGWHLRDSYFLAICFCSIFFWPDTK